MIDKFAKALENRKQIDILSLDFARAFDVVPTERLLLKLNYYGIRKLLPWFRDFLTSRTQTVIVEGVKSRLVEVTSGVPQGTRIAALCFLLFINCLPEHIQQAFAGLFCDDTLLANEISTPGDAASLQEDLDNVVNWTKLWGMSFNTDKCVVMTVTNKTNTLQTDYTLNNKTLSKESNTWVSTSTTN